MGFELKSFSSTLAGARSGSAFALAVASSCALRHAFLLVPSLRACGLQDFPCSDLTPGPCLGMSGLRVGAPAEGPPPFVLRCPSHPSLWRHLEGVWSLSGRSECSHWSAGTPSDTRVSLNCSVKSLGSGQLWKAEGWGGASGVLGLSVF